MVKFIKDEKNKILQYIETTHDVATAEDIPAEPEAKIGKTNVAYYNPDTQKIEWKQEDRPLTMEEQLEKLSKEQELTNQVLDEIVLKNVGGL